MKISMTAWCPTASVASSGVLAPSVQAPSVQGCGRGLASYVAGERSTTAPNASAHGTGLPVAGSARLRFADLDAAARGVAAPADAAVPALAPRPRGAPV